jgi:hypothetical protein
VCFSRVSLAAHVFPIGEGHGSRDDSYREGLDNLLRVLTCIGEGAPIDEIKDKVRIPIKPYEPETRNPRNQTRNLLARGLLA